METVILHLQYKQKNMNKKVKACEARLTYKVYLKQLKDTVVMAQPSQS